MQHFRRALEIGPPDVILYSNLSWACLAQRQFSEAEEFGRKAIALDARNAKAHLVLGNALASCNCVIASASFPGCSANALPKTKWALALRASSAMAFLPNSSPSENCRCARHAHERFE